MIPAGVLFGLCSRMYYVNHLSTRWEYRIHHKLPFFFAVAFVLIPQVNAATRNRMRAETVQAHAVARLAGSHSHTCQIKDDGSVRCWGTNNNGQLGDGTTTSRLQPVSVAGLFTGRATAVAAGTFFSCAVVGGSVQCWGINSFGQLGNGTTIDSLTPVFVSNIGNAVSITAGSYHACALLSNGRVLCWGRSEFGRLGNDILNDGMASTPQQVVNLSDAIAITAGSSYTCALRANGAVACWGRNDAGQLGDNTTTDRGFPLLVSGLSNAVVIGAGFNHTCAILANGAARCWGDGASGKLGDGATLRRVTPVPVAGLSDAVAISAGLNHTCAVLANGAGRCWGPNVDGQLGDGTTTRSLTPAVAAVDSAVAIVAGFSYSCASQANGVVRCWGLNNSAQHGNGTLTGSTAPNTVAGGGGGIGATAIATGGGHTCAVRGTGALACWGLNSSGQLGAGSGSAVNSLPAALSISNVISIAAGIQHTCALLVTGAVRCWGRNTFGELGDGTTTQRNVPVSVGTLSNVIGLAAGQNHTCALLANGTVQCWGRNTEGQLGLSGGSQSTPTAVAGISNAAAIAAGAFHTCALVADGSVACWGNNAQGQLGDFTTTSRFSPAPATGVLNAVAIAAGSSHTCASIADGSTRCWGANSFGQTGDGTIGGNRPVSGAVVGLSGGIGIAAGNEHSCAMVGNEARCWGRNNSGQLGNDTQVDATAPVSVIRNFVGSANLPSPLQGILQIDAGGAHTCALLVTGGPMCWGENSSGQLGDGSIADRLRPVAVPSFTLNIVPEAVIDQASKWTTIEILANCEAGRELSVEVELKQGEVTARGMGRGECTGVLSAYPVTVRVDDFSLDIGPAEVAAKAEIRQEGILVETQEWTRRVILVQEP